MFLKLGTWNLWKEWVSHECTVMLKTNSYLVDSGISSLIILSIKSFAKWKYVTTFQIFIARSISNFSGQIKQRIRYQKLIEMRACKTQCGHLESATFTQPGLEQTFSVCLFYYNSLLINNSRYSIWWSKS